MYKREYNFNIDVRASIIEYLELKEVDNKRFIKAFNFFIDNPNKFDGATIVKDLVDVKGIDLSALVHDYNYLVQLKKYRGYKWVKAKVKYDIQYGKDIAMLGKGNMYYWRTVALILITPIYPIYKLIINNN